jgi:cobalt-precorrin 5A hydrolase
MVFIGAAGIAVRTIAPLVRDKAADPAVVVIDDAGRFVVSVLSGHLGGANGLTKKIARLLGATPVVTTATDSMGLPCAEDIAGKFDFEIEDPGKIKRINSAILDSKEVFIVDANRSRLASIKKAYGRYDNFRFKRSFPKGKSEASIVVTPFTGGAPKGLKAGTLIMRPREFVVGIGCRKGAGVKEIERAFGSALKRKGLSPLSVKKLATIDIKKDEPGLLRFAGKHGLKIVFFTSGELNKKTGKVSRMVLKHTGAGAVSEPAAILGAKAKSLWSRKITVGLVTTALAREPFTS